MLAYDGLWRALVTVRCARKQGRTVVASMERSQYHTALDVRNGSYRLLALLLHGCCVILSGFCGCIAELVAGARATNPYKPWAVLLPP